MVTLEQTRPRSRSRYQRIKVYGDYLAALLLVIPLAPLFLIIALVIRLDSCGPAIYRQRRVGINGEFFTLFKFRTMHMDAPCLSTEELQLLDTDPATRVGGFLRRTSLDELPQLSNILRGEMSFIGPRPALPSQTDVNTRREELGADRACPGITGLAQVMGRDALDTETKVRYDAEYTERMSLLLDIRILWRTIAVVFSARGNR